VNKLGVLGNNIGMAFQIVDDILDFTGNETKVGKPLFNDAAQGVYTLPVIHALGSEYRKQILEALSRVRKDNGLSLYAFMDASNSIKRSKNLAEKYISKAMKSAKELPDSIGKDIIIEIINDQLERKF
jgi:heptaprenyl diphosphate synthase